MQTSDRPFPLIQIVEDNDFMRRILAESLRGYGFFHTKTGKESLEQFTRQKPEIVFLDLLLPDAYGMDLLQTMLATNPKTYIIIVSGEDVRENIDKAIGLGAKGYIVKPYSKAQVEKYIKNFLNNTFFSESSF
jgi:two-component system chemotaxis response regulator CheY